MEAYSLKRIYEIEYHLKRSVANILSFLYMKERNKTYSYNIKLPIRLLLFVVNQHFTRKVNSYIIKIIEM